MNQLQHWLNEFDEKIFKELPPSALYVSTLTLAVALLAAYLGEWFIGLALPFVALFVLVVYGTDAIQMGVQMLLALLTPEQAAQNKGEDGSNEQAHYYPAGKSQ